MQILEEHRPAAQAYANELLAVVQSTDGFEDVSVEIITDKNNESTLAMFKATAWTNSLSRKNIKSVYSIPTPNGIQRKRNLRVSLPILDMQIHIQSGRDATAKKLRLNSKAEDQLDSDRILIDRISAKHLITRDLDIYHIIHLSRCRSKDASRDTMETTRYQVEGIPTISMHLNHKSTAPVLIPKIHLKNDNVPEIIIFNNEIFIDLAFPEMIMETITGQKLGSFIETGIAEMDKRIIISAENCQNKENSFGQFSTGHLVLEPDLLTVKECISLFSQNETGAYKTICPCTKFL